jgi:hypothetical protein
MADSILKTIGSLTGAAAGAGIGRGFLADWPITRNCGFDSLID